MSKVFIEWGIFPDYKHRMYIHTRCINGDLDACILDSALNVFSEYVILYRNDERVVASLINQFIKEENNTNTNIILKIISMLRKHGFDVNLVNMDSELTQGLLTIVMQKSTTATDVVFLRVNGHVLPFVVPGFLSIRSDGSIGGTVIAPQWLVPKQCYFHVGDVSYINISGIGTFGVDSVGLLAPAPLTKVSETCGLALHDTVVVRFVDSYHTSFSILYNDFDVFKQNNAEKLDWTEEFREAIAGFEVGGRMDGVYANSTATYRLSMSELLDALYRVRNAHPNSNVTVVIGVVKAMMWFRDNAKEVLTAMVPRSFTASSSGIAMRTEEVAKVLSEYVMFLRKVASSVKPPDMPKEGLGFLRGGFHIEPGEAYWLRKALSELVGLRVRAPYITWRGAFIHEATIKRVVVRNDRIEVVMDNGLRYRIITTKLRMFDLVNFAMLLGDERVREVFMKAMKKVGEESGRVGMFVSNVKAKISNM